MLVFRSLQISWVTTQDLPTKKLDQIIYYERYVVVQQGIAKKLDGSELEYLEFLTEEEYLDILEELPEKINIWINTDPNKFIAKWELRL